MICNTLLERHPIVSDQVNRAELNVILSELDRTLQRHTSGSVVEFGCYIGTTSLFIRRLLNHYGLPHEFHVYDSFEGLPAKSQQDLSPVGTQFIAGELSVSKKEFIQQFTRQNLSVPTIHKGWFSALGDMDIPDSIVFAFLDGDYYDSIADSLRLVTPKLVKGATIVVDDYANVALPGAGKAVDEWALVHGYTVRTQQSLGIIHLN